MESRSRPAARRGGSGRLKGSPSGIKPLYKRLPHGPHRLGRDEVILHQRARIHGAMIEAVAERGYEGTSVKQVIGLAGVSRRSFYEQFANKQESFLATFDLLAHQAAQRSRRAFQDAPEAPVAERLLAAYRELEQLAREEPKQARLVLLEAQTAGADGMRHLCGAMLTAEQMLAHSFSATPDCAPLPAPVVRGIVGGLHEAAAQALRSGSIDAGSGLAEELARWTLQFETPQTSDVNRRMAAQLAARMRAVSLSAARTRRPSAGPAARRLGERERMLHSVLGLAWPDGCEDITAPQIAEEAGVSIDAFLEHFADRNECFLAALQMVGDELLSTLSDPDLESAERWPLAVRGAVGRLMRLLGERPLYARTIARSALLAGREAVRRDTQLSREIVSALTAGAPPTELALVHDAIAGAIWHTIRCQVMSDRVPMLGALSDYLSFLVLTPFVGVERAGELVSDVS